MSNERKYIQHYYTNNPESIPSAELLNDAEIALNIAADNEKIFIKNTSNEIVTFRDDKYYQESLNTLNTSIDNKVDKLDGKQLSTEDFTTTLKEKLTSINAKLQDTSDVIDDVDTNTYVKYVQQSLTDEQKLQVRENIGLVDNSEKSNVYVTDFTFENLINVPDSGILIKKELFDAVENNKIIIIPSLSDAGGFIASAYVQHRNGTALLISVCGKQYGSTNTHTQQVYIYSILPANANSTTIYQRDITVKTILDDTNVKTINGQSLVGTGDIKIEASENITEKYITDFTITDIFTLYHAETEGEVSVKITRELVNAIEDGKTVFIPTYREEEVGTNFKSETITSTMLMGNTDKIVGIAFNSNTEYYALSVTIPEGNEFVELTKGNISLKDFSKSELINYSELKILRDNGGLAPGTFYRITDYITTTVQDNTSSAGHPFDVIVLATSENTLSEEAYAIKSERDNDNYFGTSNLSAWKIWYCLDNDANRFGWADAENGTGVIYRMIDEWNNDVPYDFKNILYTPDIPFVKVSIKAYGSYFSGVITRNSAYDINANGKTYYGWDYSITQGPSSTGVVLTDTLSFSLETVFYTQDSLTPTDVVKVEEVYTQVYTFGYNIDDTLSSMSTHNNTILPYATYQGYWVKLLNSIIFGTYCNNNTFGNDCYNNTFGDNCRFNTFGNSYFGNTFGNGCYYNTFGNSCYYNTFGNGCYYNTFGDNCDNNTFGNICNDNTLGNYCGNNTFGDNCKYNTIDSNCNSNIFGNNCYNNTFGNNCYNNTFGNSYSDNTFGTYCDNNTFGYECDNNTFGNNCRYNTFGIDCRYNTFGNDCGKENSGNTLNSGCTFNEFGSECYNNTLGDVCTNNTFGTYCNNNTFGNDCQNNTFGYGCTNNTFDIDCNNNTLGDDCNNNTFDEGCGYNKFNKHCMKNTIMFGCSFNIFGVGCQDNAFGGMCRANTMAFYCCNNTLSNSCHYNSFSNNCSYNSINRETMTNNGVLKNLVITNGVGGSSESINEIIIPDNLLDVDYEIKIAKNSSGEIKIYCEADLKNGDKPLIVVTDSEMMLLPNVYYRNTNNDLSSLTITLAAITNESIVNEYFVEFTTRENMTTILLPDTIQWANGVLPIWEAGCTYQLSIVNNLGVAMKFK